MLGFDTEVLGQGSGRNPDGIAVAARNDHAVIYDAKKRQDGYRIGRDGRTTREYIQSRVDSDEELTDLDKAQFLRYRWEHGKSVSEFLSKWEITDGLRELCEGSADATGDDTYRNILESRLSDY